MKNRNGYAPFQNAHKKAKNLRQVDVPIVYDRMTFDKGQHLEVLVEELIICEPKTVDQMNPVEMVSNLE